MATATPLFTAVSSSARQVLLLLRCISFAKKAHVRLSSDGLRFNTDEGSIMEASVFLDRALFSSFTYTPPTTDQDQPDAPYFEVNMTSLLETLNIFSLSDPTTAKRPGAGGEFDNFAVHRLNRHANINNFANQPLGVTGICTISYDGEGSPLSIHMVEAGVTTTCHLTTYVASSTEEIPFDREHLSLKTIMRSNHLLDAIAELGSMNPTSFTIAATPRQNVQSASLTSSTPNLSLSAGGSLGSVSVDFAATDSVTAQSEQYPPILETFHCPARTSASFQFHLVKHAQRAMHAATKVSLRLDNEGVLSLQFLVEIDTMSGTAASGQGDGIAFVDFRVVPLVEGEGDDSNTDEE